MTENRIFTLCRMITWVVFLRMFWNFISSLPVKRGGYLSFLVGTIGNVLVMEIGWTDVGRGGYILVSCAHSNTSYEFKVILKLNLYHFYSIIFCKIFPKYIHFYFYFQDIKDYLNGLNTCDKQNLWQLQLNYLIR